MRIRRFILQPTTWGSDEAMGGVLLDILIVIIAFIFAVTISNTITKESSAIGTLRASGYTKGELVRPLSVYAGYRYPDFRISRKCAWLYGI